MTLVYIGAFRSFFLGIDLDRDEIESFITVHGITVLSVNL